VARLMLVSQALANPCSGFNAKLPELAQQILRYLQDHPRAQDTIEGITAWWVSERAISRWLPQVRSSLAALVAQGYIAKHTGPGGRIFYRLSRRTGRSGRSQVSVENFRTSKKLERNS